MLPPNNLEFNVTTIDPIHTITKTSANSGPPSLKLFAVSEEPCNILKQQQLVINVLRLIIIIRTAVCEIL